VNREAVTADTEPPSIELGSIGGTGTFIIMVTAENGTTQKTYTVHAERILMP